MIEPRFRFTLTKRQVEDLEDNLLLDDDIVTSGIEQPDGTYQYDLGYEDLVNLVESLAAAAIMQRIIESRRGSTRSTRSS